MVSVVAGLAFPGHSGSLPISTVDPSLRSKWPDTDVRAVIEARLGYIVCVGQISAAE